MKELFDESGQGQLPQVSVHRNPGLEIVYLRHWHLVWQYNRKTEAVRPGLAPFHPAVTAARGNSSPATTGVSS